MEVVEGVPFTWDVIQEDIDKGEPQSSWSCPVALSLMRLLPGKHIVADTSTICVHEHDPVTEGPGTMIWQAQTPDNAEGFICDFDDDEPVEPFTITVAFRKAVV